MQFGMSGILTIAIWMYFFDEVKVKIKSNECWETLLILKHLGDRADVEKDVKGGSDSNIRWHSTIDAWNQTVNQTGIFDVLFCNSFRFHLNFRSQRRVVLWRIPWTV